MPRRPRKNTTMDQFFTKSAHGQPGNEGSRSPQEQKAVGAAAQSVDVEQGGTPLKKRPRRSVDVARTLTPQRLLQEDGRSNVPASRLLTTSSVANCSDATSSQLAPASSETTREPPPPLTEEHERLLKDFDLRSRFGAAAGVDRLVRWERAHRLGLKPPSVVKEILLMYTGMPEVRRSVLDAHLLRYDPGGDSGVRC